MEFISQAKVKLRKLKQKGSNRRHSWYPGDGQSREQLSLYLDSEEEAEHWAEMLKVTSVHRSLSFEGLNLECGPAVSAIEDSSSDSSELGEELHGCSGSSVADEDDQCSGDNTPDNSPSGKRRQPRLRGIHNDSRKELLQQMLATKSMLEKKQKHRRSGVGAWAMTAGEVVNEYDRAQHEAQQEAMRRAVLLRQRKNSTAIKMASLEKGAGLGKRENNRSQKKPPKIRQEMEVLRKHLSSLDSQMQEDDKNVQKTLHDIEERRNNDLDIIKDLGGDGMEEDLNRLSVCEDNASQRGSVASIPSIVINSSEKADKKTPEKIFGFRVGGRDRRLKPRNPLNFLDIKLKVHRRHKSTENLSTRKHEEEHSHRSHASTPGNLSTRSNSSNSNHNSDISDEETEHHNSPRSTRSIIISDPIIIRTEISPEALAEIEAFKDIISRYFSNHPRHDSVTNRDYNKETKVLINNHSQELIL